MRSSLIATRESVDGLAGLILTGFGVDGVVIRRVDVAAVTPEALDGVGARLRADPAAAGIPEFVPTTAAAPAPPSPVLMPAPTPAAWGALFVLVLRVWCRRLVMPFGLGDPARLLAGASADLAALSRLPGAPALSGQPTR